MDELKCPLCLSAVDTEIRFVLCCRVFDDLRYEFIKPKYFNNPCEFRLALLVATQKERTLTKKIVLCFGIKKHSLEDKNPIEKNSNVHNELIIKYVIISNFSSSYNISLPLCSFATFQQL